MGFGRCRAPQNCISRFVETALWTEPFCHLPLRTPSRQRAHPFWRHRFVLQIERFLTRFCAVPVRLAAWILSGFGRMQAWHTGRQRQRKRELFSWILPLAGWGIITLGLQRKSRL